LFLTCEQCQRLRFWLLRNVFRNVGRTSNIFSEVSILIWNTHIFIFMHKCTIPVHMISGANVETARRRIFNFHSILLSVLAICSLKDVSVKAHWVKSWMGGYAG
jgi:hypothetical protein